MTQPVTLKKRKTCGNKQAFPTRTKGEMHWCEADIVVTKTVEVYITQLQKKKISNTAKKIMLTFKALPDDKS